MPEKDKVEFAQLATRAWATKRSLDTRNEISHAFSKPALLQMSADSLSERSREWSERVDHTQTEISEIQTQIDEKCFELYEIDEAGRRAITEGFGPPQPDSESESLDTDSVGEEENEESEANDDAATLAAELVSWAVGVAFGRFDIYSATKSVQPLSRPFDPLPESPPAALVANDKLPLTKPYDGYPIAFPEDGILVDDPGHPRDLTSALRGVFDEVFAAMADAWWSDVGSLLDPKGRQLKAWLTTGLFEYHLKLHSKSRRKAPIVWQLAVPSGRFSIWLYAHRVGRDSFIHIQNDVMAPKISHEERQLAALVQSAGAHPNASARKEIDDQESLVEELREMLAEVRRVAPMWKPILGRWRGPSDGSTLAIDTAT
jgi:hypothetical protein